MSRITVQMSVRPDIKKEAQRISQNMLGRVNLSMLFETFVNQHIEGENMYKSIVDNAKKIQDAKN